MKKTLILIICAIALLFVAINVQAWTITTNSTSKNRWTLDVIMTSSNAIYASTNWGMPKRFQGRVTPEDIFVTYLSNSGAFAGYLRCSIVSTKTLGFKWFRYSANAPDYVKARVTIYVPSPDIK